MGEALIVLVLPLVKALVIVLTVPTEERGKGQKREAEGIRVVWVLLVVEVWVMVLMVPRASVVQVLMKVVQLFVLWVEGKREGEGEEISGGRPQVED